MPNVMKYNLIIFTKQSQSCYMLWKCIVDTDLFNPLAPILQMEKLRLMKSGELSQSHKA